MLSQRHRFHGHGSLRYLYKNGQAVRSHFMTVKCIKNPRRSHSRFAIVISKKVLKSAVGRNRIRRRIYEIMREDLAHIHTPHDIVVMVFSSELLTMSNEDLVALVHQLFEQAGLYN